jgi:hypothetical protein
MPKFEREKLCSQKSRNKMKNSCKYYLHDCSEDKTININNLNDMMNVKYFLRLMHIAMKSGGWREHKLTHRKGKVIK